MKQPLPLMNSLASFELVSRQIDEAVRAGKLDRDKAGRVLKDARSAYRNQVYNKAIEKENMKR